MRVAAEDGQASVELVSLVLVVSLALGALAALAPRADGRSIGGFLAHHIVCAATGGCHAAERALDFVARAIQTAPGLGAGHGPINHFVPGPATTPER